MKKKIGAFLIALALLCSTVIPIDASGDEGELENIAGEIQQTESNITAPEEPSVSAYSAILYLPDSGEILYQKRIDEKLPIASITKIMTALIAFEEASSNDKEVKFTPQMQAEGSSMYIKNGEILKLSELAKGMMMVSGNDAANAIAITIGGSQEGFAKLMNERAKQLGMKNTSFVTPSGLDDENHYSTAYDMAILTAYAMENEQFKNTVSQKSINISYVSPENKTQLCTNHNRLLSTYDGCIGVKTGFTKSAGRTLVSCAERNGIRLIAVTLNDGDDWNDHEKLYDYGFETVRTQMLCKKTDSIELPVVGSDSDSVILHPARDTDIAVSLEQSSNIETEIVLPRFVYAPVRKGKIEGKIIYRLKGKTVAVTDLISDSECLLTEKKQGFFEKIFSKWF